METAKLLPLAFELQDTKSVAVYLQGLLTQQGHFRQGVKMKPPPDRVTITQQLANHYPTYPYGRPTISLPTPMVGQPLAFIKYYRIESTREEKKRVIE